jgi:hypothetical protein
MTLCLLATLLLAVLASPLSAAEVVGEWTFDEGAGDVAKDVSGKGRDGRIVGARWTEGLRGKALEFKGPDYPDGYVRPGTVV